MHESWQKWFNQIYSNNNGTPQAWTPLIIGLTGAATITGSYVRLAGLIHWQVLITPTVNTTAILGTTYVSNLPFTASAFSTLTAIKTTSRISIGIGQVDANTTRAYPLGWTAVAEPVLLTGTYQCQP